MMTIPLRLRFRAICSAVSNAHQNLVVHRDLKPSNILITHEGEPKLLDFGVAKFLNPELMGEGLAQTRTRFQVLTPQYASPEQMRGGHITTASDIYSLGVVLYELLTGSRHYKLSDSTPEAMVHAICDSEPSRPSDALSSEEREKGRRRVGEKSKSSRSAGPSPLLPLCFAGRLRQHRADGAEKGTVAALQIRRAVFRRHRKTLEGLAGHCAQRYFRLSRFEVHRA